MSRQDLRAGNVRLDDIDYHQHNVRVDLGDLRDLTDSIARFGVLQPVVLEQRGQRLRIRAGHRRVAAARLAGLTRIPALVHADAFEDDEWLIAAVHENTRRKGLDLADRVRTVQAMRAAGLTLAAIADAFDTTPRAVRSWCDRKGGSRGLSNHGKTVVGARNAEAVAREDVRDPVTGERPSAAEIARRVGLSSRTVTRARSRLDQRPPVTRTSLGPLLPKLREEARRRGWSAEDVIDAVERYCEAGTHAAALDHEVRESA